MGPAMEISHLLQALGGICLGIGIILWGLREWERSHRVPRDLLSRADKIINEGASTMIVKNEKPVSCSCTADFCRHEKQICGKPTRALLRASFCLDNEKFSPEVEMGICEDCWEKAREQYPHLFGRVEQAVK
jgi:hypothetical protein